IVLEFAAMPVDTPLARSSFNSQTPGTWAPALSNLQAIWERANCPQIALRFSFPARRRKVPTRHGLISPRANRVARLCWPQEVDFVTSAGQFRISHNWR